MMLCQVCEKNPAEYKCQGCEKMLCADCLKFDLFGHGCGCIIPVLMCQTCINDVTKNPYTTGTF